MLHLKSNIQNWGFGYRAHACGFVGVAFSHAYLICGVFWGLFFAWCLTQPRGSTSWRPKSNADRKDGRKADGSSRTSNTHPVWPKAAHWQVYRTLANASLTKISAAQMDVATWILCESKTCDGGSHTEVCIMSVLALPGPGPHWSMYNECFGPSKLQSEPQGSKMVDL